MPEAVSAWMGDCFRTDKLHWHKPRHPGRLSRSHPTAFLRG